MIKTGKLSGSGVVRTLSESEIQERLYGPYLGRRKAPEPAAPGKAVFPPAQAKPVRRSKKKPSRTQVRRQRRKKPVSRVRSRKAPQIFPDDSVPTLPLRQFPNEEISLSVSVPSLPADPEWSGSEILNGELNKLRSELISLRQEKDRLSNRLERISRFSSFGKSRLNLGRWSPRSLSLFLLVGAVLYLIGGRALQASPAIGDSTPYTVQVAVYEGPKTAARAQRFLRELGYDALLLEMPRKNGKLRYRVYVGSFVTKEEANQESRRLASDARFQAFKDAFVRIR